MIGRALLLSAILLLPAAGLAAPADEALTRTKALVAAFARVPPTEGPARAKAFADIDGFLALDDLTSQAVAPREAKFSPRELARFKKDFREVLRLVAYGESGAFFRKARITWGAPEAKGEELRVAAKVVVPDEDLTTALEFRWKRIGGVLRVVDVAFEGDSLLRDYQNQIARIVDKSGPAGLQKAIDDRRAELEKERRK